jgi:rhodanese-related sulfurtransferase
MIKRNKKLQLIDNRSEKEYKLYSIKGTINVPMIEVNSYIEKIDKKRPVVFLCASGIRGYFAGMLILTYSHDEVYNLLDGLVGAWLKAGLPTN